MRVIRELVIEITIVTAIGVLLAALGPFGSFESSFPVRLAYWVPAALVGYAIFRPLTLVAAWVGGKLHLPEIPSMYVGSLIAAVPATLAIAMLGGFGFGREASFDGLFQLYLNVALIGLVIGTIFLLIHANRTEKAPVETHAQSPMDHAVPIRAAFLDRLPPAWDGNLRALEMEDHYVRAHGPDGKSELLLMRMRDAEAELAGVDGMRVHRSWWVARQAVTGKRRDGRSLTLLLDGGIEAPVARERSAELRAKGWI